MSWTTPRDLKAQVQKLWDRGVLLACLAGEESIFPRRLTLKGPGSRELSDRFPEVREWMGQLRSTAGPYRIEWRRLNHRVLGANDIPVAVWVDSLADALTLIGQRRAAERFAAQVALTADKQPALLPWLRKRPLLALKLAEDWPYLLEIVSWCHAHPRPAVFLRQIDLPGVHSKFIEGHRGVLAELLDLVLPENVIATDFTGLGGFCRRYGFRDKPAQVRFRLLDPQVRLLPGVADQDITLNRDAFSALHLPLARVFITENEINFLTFPLHPAAMVIFGAGYGFENLSEISWLARMEIFYWGDIDTHGFAILNQLRRYLPHTVSFLMDQQTLLKHRELWGTEKQPETGNLTRLTREEMALYDQLRSHYWGSGVRLEQERIGFELLQAALQGMTLAREVNSDATDKGAVDA